jgi:DNA excision repair protein ERCC-1
LRNLPGFGQVKVKNIKNAFDKPVRNKATRTLPTTASQDQRVLASRDQDTVAQSTSKKGKEKEPSTGLGRPARDPSPVWDIELDLDDGPAQPRRPQPFDIELDLN